MIRIAVVTGGHSFDVIGFHKLFRGLEGVDAYIQPMDDFAASSKDVREGYDVVLFYNMNSDTPTDEGQPWYAGKPLEAISALKETGQGIIVLHHALLAYPKWNEWDCITGIKERTFGYFPEQTVDSIVVDAGHPICQDLTPWSMMDETYTLPEPKQEEGNRILLEYRHPRSMRSAAWTRMHGKSKVLCYVAGHDDATWSNPGFKNFLQKGISWCASK